MSTLTCTLEEFKKIVAEFCKAAPSANLEQLDAGFKCVSLHYLGIEPPPKMGSAQEIMATSYLDYASNQMIKREMEISDKLS